MFPPSDFEHKEISLMETFITITHIIVALILIALVLLQDSKSGSLGGAFGGGGSNSVLGATGATSLAQKITRYIAVIFAATSITLSVFATRAHKSIMDTTSPTDAPAASAPAATPATTPAAPAPTNEPKQ